MCYLQLLPPGKPRRSQSGASLCCTSAFQPQCYGCFEWNNYLFWRAVLYIEGCVATSLASTHYMSAARLSPLWGNQKRLQSLLSVLWGVKSALAESPFRSIEQHEAGAEFSPGSLGGKLAWVQEEKVFPPNCTIPVPCGELSGAPDLSQERTALREAGKGVRGLAARHPGLLRVCVCHSPISQMVSGSAAPIEPSVVSPPHAIRNPRQYSGCVR